MYTKFDGYGERFRNVMLYSPIYQLSHSTKYNDKGINLMELGFATLVFMLEEMLENRRRITPVLLTSFLKSKVLDIYGTKMTNQEAEELRRYLIDTRLRNEGRKFEIPYYDFETGEEKRLMLDLIVYDDYTLQNIGNKEIYLKLSTEAIELILKTREVYAELQISITMLYFKQQLEKGAYQMALRTVTELLLHIERQIEEFENRMNRIRANTLTEFDYDKLSRQLENSKEQTERDREELGKLKKQVKAVKENYQAVRLSKSQQNKLNQVEEIDKQLRKCMTRHEALFIKKQELLQTVKTSFELLIENMFSRVFHFEREILNNWVDRRMDENKLETILTPMNRPRYLKFYNPMEAFLPQKAVKKRDTVEDEIPIVDEEEIERQNEQEEQRKRHRDRLNLKLAEALFEPIFYYEEYRLSDAMSRLRERDFGFFQELSGEYHTELWTLCINIHQEEYKEFEPHPLDQVASFSETIRLLVKLTHKYSNLADIGGFEIQSTKDSYEFPDGQEITDFLIKRKEKSNDVQFRAGQSSHADLREIKGKQGRIQEEERFVTLQPL